MKVRARELQEGQRIHIEYGDHGNWVDITIGEVNRFPHKVIAMCFDGTIRLEVLFRPDEQVEVLQENA